MQETLRAELRSELGESEDGQLVNSLPYLDAFTSEVFRTHPGVAELNRDVSNCLLRSFFELCFHLPCSQVHIDDTLPLTHPILTASGEFVDRIFVAKGTVIRIPVVAINNSEFLWGKDTDKFDPKRWLEPNRDEGGRWTEIQGYKNLLTFGSGPRMCVGKNFAINEIKVRICLSISPSLLQWRRRSSFPSWALGRPVRFSTPLQL